MRMKKNIVAVYLLCALFFAFATGTAAVSEEAIKPCRSLSYGLDVIRRTVKVVKTASPGSQITFSVYDFTTALGRNDITGITLSTLPDREQGTLKFGALDAYVGQTVSAGMIENLRFIPASGSAEASFSVTLSGSGDEVECLLYSVSESAVKPEAEGMKLYSYKDIPVYSAFEASGTGLSYKIVSLPSHGLVSVKADGSFLYTPAKGYTGRDAFTYTVTDKYGASSAEATVAVKIEKQSGSVVYSDMSGNSAGYAAVLLAEKNIFIGSSVGGLMSFSPEQTVSRIDFLMMAMKAAGYSSNIYTATQTGLADEALLSSTQKGYVITALALGIIFPEDYQGVSIWRPTAVITQEEASSILRCISGGEGLTEVIAQPAEPSPALTREACKKSGEDAPPARALTRAHA